MMINAPPTRNNARQRAKTRAMSIQCSALPTVTAPSEAPNIVVMTGNSRSLASTGRTFAALCRRQACAKAGEHVRLRIDG